MEGQGRREKTGETWLENISYIRKKAKTMFLWVFDFLLHPALQFLDVAEILGRSWIAGNSSSVFPNPTNL